MKGKKNAEEKGQAAKRDFLARFAKLLPSHTVLPAFPNPAAHFQ